MAKKRGYERNSFFDEDFRASNISLRGFRYRDLKSTSNKEILTKRKETYTKVQDLMKAAKNNKNR